MDDRTRPLGTSETDTDWLIPDAAAPDELRHDGRLGRSERRPLGVAAALVAGGALVGAVAVSMLHNTTSPSASANPLPAAATNGNGPAGGQPGQGQPLPGQQGQLPGGTLGDRGDGEVGDGFRGRGGGGGLAGEQRLSGTLTAVGGSSVTVKTSSGTATYTVTSTTEIVRDGAAATLGQLQVGDPVFVHVYPASSGGALVVERLFAGTTTGFGGPPPGGTSTT
jgi:hypothetical protein